MSTPDRPLSAVPDPFQPPTTVDSKEVLAAVQYEQREGHEASDSETLYQFEGKNVKATAAKITSVAGLEIDDSVWRVDQYVRMVVECRVVAVDHKVNEKSGVLARVHLLKAIDSKVLPWEAEV
jgi:hypothetical protein